MRRVAGSRVPLVLTGIRRALGGVGFLRDHVRISEAETGEVEGLGKGGRVTNICNGFYTLSLLL